MLKSTPLIIVRKDIYLQKIIRDDLFLLISFKIILYPARKISPSERIKFTI